MRSLFEGWSRRRRSERGTLLGYSQRPDGLIERTTWSRRPDCRASPSKRGFAVRRRTSRYLWTDAFALATSRSSGRSTFRRRLPRARVRARQSAFTTRSAASATTTLAGDGSAGSTRQRAGCTRARGGLRIGKRFPERGPRAMFEPELEWERDGQYFHYLSEMDARARSVQPRDARRLVSNLWAERARRGRAPRLLMAGSRSAPHLYWKMSDGPLHAHSSRRGGAARTRSTGWATAGAQQTPRSDARFVEQALTSRDSRALFRACGRARGA